MRFKILKTVIQKVLSIFVIKTSFIKYEIKICCFSQIDIEENGAIIKMQNDGWEICGSIGVPQTRKWVGDPSITVPFRRRLNCK